MSLWNNKQAKDTFGNEALYAFCMGPYVISTSIFVPRISPIAHLGGKKGGREGGRNGNFSGLRTATRVALLPRAFHTPPPPPLPPPPPSPPPPTSPPTTSTSVAVTGVVPLPATLLRLQQHRTRGQWCQGTSGSVSFKGSTHPPRRHAVPQLPHNPFLLCSAKPKLPETSRAVKTQL